MTLCSSLKTIATLEMKADAESWTRHTLSKKKMLFNNGNQISLGKTFHCTPLGRHPHPILHIEVEC